MGDSVKKHYEKTIYPGDIKVTVDSYPFNEKVDKQPMIYESPDGGKTIRSRPAHQPITRDKYVQDVKNLFEERSQAGIKKYNTTLERDDVDLLGWLTHLQEELMDATLYIQKLKSEVTKNS